MERRILLDAVSRYYWVIFAFLIVLGTVGGYVAYSTYTATETVTEQRVVSTATTSSEFSHSSTVREDVGVFSEGVELQNRKIYFTSLSPRLDGNYTVRHGGTNPRPASARIDLRLVLRSVGDGGTVYWKESEQLASANESSLEPGTPLSASFAVNITRSLNRIKEVRQSLGASPGSAEVLIEANSVVEGNVGGERYVDTRSEQMEVSPGRSTYSASASTEGRKLHEARETVVRERRPSNSGVYGGTLVFIGSVLCFILLERKREKGEFSVPEEEIKEAKFESEREDFDEWISQGTIPGGDRRLEVHLSSLADAVDTAIDTNSRVIETEEGKEYVVLTEDIKYIFRRGGGLPSTSEDLEDMSHSDLKGVAEELGIEENQSTEKLTEDIAEELGL